MEVPVPQPRRKNENRNSSEEVKEKKFLTLHREAYEMTKMAVELDEGGKREAAFTAYSKALQVIDKAVEFAHTGGFPSVSVENIDSLVYKMRMRRKEILERVSDIQHTDMAASYLEGPSSSHAQPDENFRLPPPPYGVQSRSLSLSGGESQHQAISRNLYGTLNRSLDEIATHETSNRNPLPLNAEEVFSIADGVQIYFISRNDFVSAPSYPSFLRIVVINSEEGTRTEAPSFLQVGDWTYPLLPGQSPIYHAPDGSYVFPDTRPGETGGSVGLILPIGVSPDDRQGLEDVLVQLIGQSALRGTAESTEIISPVQPLSPQSSLVQPLSPQSQVPETMASKIASGLISGGEKVAYGLVYGAEKTSQYLEKGAGYLVSRLEPVEEKPSLHPQLRSGMKTARSVTRKGVKVSGFVVEQVRKGTVKLGQQMAPYLHRGATQIFAKTMGKDEQKAGQQFDEFLEVTGGAVQGLGTVFIGLEHAAVVLAKSLRNNTVTVVQHKYGTEAASLCDDTTTAVGNTLVTGYNVKCLGPKTLAKTVAKDTGKAVVASASAKDKESTPNSK